MKAQVAFLAFAQTLGEFGLALPQPLDTGEALLKRLIAINDMVEMAGLKEHGKPVTGARKIHEKLRETDQVRMIAANPTSAGVARITEDRRAIVVQVPTTTSPFAEGITERGSLAYRIYFVKQEQPGQWEAVTMHEPIKTTDFDPKIHTLTQTLGFWPNLPAEPVRYGLVVEQVGDWKVTQEKKTGKGKTWTAFANPADEGEFLKALEASSIAMRSLFYESMSNPDHLTPFTERLGKLLAVFKEKGYEDLLKAPMYTAEHYKTEVINYALAFCGRVGDQNYPGNLIPLGLHCVNLKV